MAVNRAHLREQLNSMTGWLDEREAAPARQELAAAVRDSLQILVEEIPGKAVEVRVPPFGAVQVVPGPAHTRGTPSNVVEMTPIVWLQLATGKLELDHAISAGKVDISGTRAYDINSALPVLTCEHSRPRSDLSAENRK